MARGEFTAADRARCWERSKGRCEVCGAFLREHGWNLHHRSGRGMGGTRRKMTPADGLVVCGQGNTSGCHRLMDVEREWAERHGFVVRRNSLLLPAQVPVMHAAYGWVWLMTTGEVVAVAEWGETPDVG